jgi:hypothetical protein
VEQLNCPSGKGAVSPVPPDGELAAVGAAQDEDGAAQEDDACQNSPAAEVLELVQEDVVVVELIVVEVVVELHELEAAPQTPAGALPSAHLYSPSLIPSQTLSTGMTWPSTSYT